MKYQPWLTESLLFVAIILLFGIIGSIELSAEKDMQIARKNYSLEDMGRY